MECSVHPARPLANFRPNLWGDYFLTAPCHEATDGLKEQEAKEMKEKVREKLGRVVGDPKERLILIDAVERLGVSYHFEEEIETSLQEIHKKHPDDDISYKHDLHYTALRFRLLRQHGFHVSCGAFENFKNDKGSFKGCSESDVEGLLNLYEASFLRVDGENILEEVRAFTTTHLTSMAMHHNNSSLSEQINHALKHPLHRSTRRLYSRYFMSFYQNHPSHDPILLRFAKFDFDLLQSLHRNEIRQIIRWSKDLEFTSKLGYARDRDVEGFFWILSAYYEPKYSFARLIQSKLFKLISLVDDTYDAYGTFQELQLFTQAIQRWDRNLMNQLPDYMKFLYKTILDTFEELEQNLAERGESHAVYYMQRELKALCEAYFQEAQWKHQGYVPTYDEYMMPGVESSGYFYTITACYQGMAKIATRNAFEWIRQDVKVSRASAVLFRILNDIGSHKAEQSRGHVASAVECLMVHNGLTLEEAIKKLQQQEEEAWMSINQGMLRPYPIPLPLLNHIVNQDRVLYDIYSIDEDGYTTSSHSMQQKVKALLIDSAINSTV